MDKNLFRDSQLLNSSQRWELRCQSDTTGVDSGNNPKNGSAWDHILLAGVISDTEVGMSVNNSFEVNTPEGIGKMLKDTVDSANKIIDTANYNLSFAEGALENLAGAISTFVGEGAADSFSGAKEKYNETFDKWQQNIANKLGIQSSNWLNSQIVVGTDYVKMFRSSTPTYDIPSVSTIFYHGDVYQNDDPDDGLVLNKVQELIERFVARYATLGQGTGVNSNENQNSNPMDDGAMLGVMFAPNDYEANFLNIGRETSIKGTFRLKYGDHVYKNLLVSSFSFKLSTLKVLGPDGKPTNQPLYAEIQLGFEPCTLLTQQNMINFIRGK